MIETRCRVTGVGPDHPGFVEMLHNGHDPDTQEVVVGHFMLGDTCLYGAAVVEREPTQ